MFGFTYTERVQIRRLRRGSMGASGRPEYDLVKTQGDDAPLEIPCRIEERGRVTIDARQRQVRTDATMLYRPQGAQTLEAEDVVLRAGGAAYEVVGIETVKLPLTAEPYSRVDLVKTATQAGGAA